ncbi:hypothetical protein [Brevundimonas sp.]|uniref:hypothetical protein n=1 Tax=Brevundimonas sp. TaxID=1871086 RepID=UPI003D1482DB
MAKKTQRDETLQTVSERLAEFVIEAAQQRVESEPKGPLGLAMSASIERAVKNAVDERLDRFQEAQSQEVADAIIKKLHAQGEREKGNLLARHWPIAVAAAVALLLGLAGGVLIGVFLSDPAGPEAVAPTGSTSSTVIAESAAIPTPTDEAEVPAGPPTQQQPAGPGDR